MAFYWFIFVQNRLKNKKDLETLVRPHIGFVSWLPAVAEIEYLEKQLFSSKIHGFSSEIEHIGPESVVPRQIFSDF